MKLRVAHFNILGRHMAGSMWFHYARDFLPPSFATAHPDWTRMADFPRALRWSSQEGAGRFCRFDVLLAEIRALRADLLCLVELDCFDEFRDALVGDGFEAVFQPRPGKRDGCGIFWRKALFEASAGCRSLVYSSPPGDRIALLQPLRHIASGTQLVVVSTHLHWDQAAGHQESETAELLAFLDTARTTDSAFAAGVIVCGDLNTTPDSAAYKLLANKLSDAAAPGGSTDYSATSFTSLKPDVYYFARPREWRTDANAATEWHFQEGRSEVIDYVFFDPSIFVLDAPAVLPDLGAATLKSTATEEPVAKRAKTAKPPYGFWAGGWEFEASPDPALHEHRWDANWRPKRARGRLQLGIPNRLHGSDHLPLVCSLRLRNSVRSQPP